LDEPSGGPWEFRVPHGIAVGPGDTVVAADASGIVYVAGLG
jgi:hypothetical protein